MVAVVMVNFASFNVTGHARAGRVRRHACRVLLRVRVTAWWQWGVGARGMADTVTCTFVAVWDAGNRQAIGRVDGVFKGIAQVLVNHAGHAKAVTSACGALFRLAFDEST